MFRVAHIELILIGMTHWIVELDKITIQIKLCQKTLNYSMIVEIEVNDSVTII